MLRAKIRAHVTRWLTKPLLTGKLAVMCAITAVALPTIVRAALNGVVTGCEFTPYVPFVLISAILLRWWQSGLIALAATATMGGLFEGALMHPSVCFIPAAITFMGTSAVMIGIAVSARQVIRALQNPGIDESAGGIVFSLENGQVWASWYGQGAPLRLGTRLKVSSMMRDFLAQEELAKRLNRNPDGER